MNCPECGSLNIKTDFLAGEIVCIDCGFTLEHQVTAAPAPGEIYGKPHRGPPLTEALHDRGLGTLLPEKAGRLAKLHSRVATSSPKDKHLARLLSEIGWVVGRTGASNEVLEHASHLGRKAVMQGVVRRASRAVACAVVYLAMRESGYHRTLNDLCVATNVSFRSLARHCRTLIFKLSIKPRADEPEKLLPKLIYSLGLPPSLESTALVELNALRARGLTLGRRPMTISAAAVYLASISRGIPVSMAKVASAAPVSDLSLRNLIRAARDEKVMSGKS